MAIVNGQKGIWVKKKGDASPVFVGLGQADTPDEQIEASKQGILKSIGGNVEWSGEDPSDFNIQAATGNVKAFTPATPDVVGDTYFDTLLKQTQQEYQAQRGLAQQSYSQFTQQLKESRQLFNKNLEQSYGKALQKVNVNAYDRGVGDSGVKTENFRDTTKDKEYTNEQRDFEDKQREAIASTDLQNRLDAIGRTEERARASFKSPYGQYSY